MRKRKRGTSLEELKSRPLYLFCFASKHHRVIDGQLFPHSGHRIVGMDAKPVTGKPAEQQQQNNQAVAEPKDVQDVAQFVCFIP